MFATIGENTVIDRDTINDENIFKKWTEADEFVRQKANLL